jgi:predicted metal-dependent hydrolase
MSEPTRATERIDIVQRHMGFVFPKDLPRHWNANDPYETQLLNALSLVFPKGEQMFIDRVRVFRDQITDGALREDVRAFIGQEAQHRKEHEAFNAWIEAQGFPVEGIYAFIDARQAETAKAPAIVQLAAVTALEHFTALMAEWFLTDEEAIAAMDERVRALWVWHAIEETEHKAVAFDVYQHVGGTYPVRVLVMAVVTAHFMTNVSRFHYRLMQADGQSTNVASWAKGWWKFWGPRGRFTKLVPGYLDYYRPDFHPWQRDNRPAVAKWKAWIDAQAKRVMPRAHAPADREAA